jgi:hypothetical protein
MRFTDPLRPLSASVALAGMYLGAVALPTAIAADCGTDGHGGDDFVTVFVNCQRPASGGQTAATAGGASEASASVHLAVLQYRWHTPCLPFAPNHQAGDAPDCVIARMCPDPAARSWQLWALPADTQTWAYVSSQCFAGLQPPTVADAPRPQVTPGLVLNALRQIGLPALEAHTQPEDKTLVNFATIFYAEPQTFVRTLTLLGQQVHVEATPSSYTWHYGDGTSTTTSTPGAPYPAKDITHNYADAHTTVQTSVDVTYSARFQVGNGGWQDIPETVTIVGPQSALRISEATAVLSGDYN